MSIALQPSASSSYNPAVDGLRAVAVLLVMLFHAKVPLAKSGFLGVDVFFVISGFLITGILLDELKSHQRIDIRRFLRHRILRLAPALTAMLAVYLLLAPILWPAQSDHLLQAALALGYLTDYSVALARIPDQLSHTWSLSVEMHFYLLWPWLLALLWRQWAGLNLAKVLLLGYLISTSWRIILISSGLSWSEIFYRFDARLSGLLLGAALAAAAASQVDFRRLQGWAILWLGVMIALLLALPQGWGSRIMLAAGISLIEFAAALVLILLFTRQSWLYRLLAMPLLVWLGKLSYGLYLWHYPIFVYLRSHLQWPEVLLIGTPLSILLAGLSYYTLERYCRQLRKS